MKKIVDIIKKFKFGINNEDIKIKSNIGNEETLDDDVVCGDNIAQWASDWTKVKKLKSDFSR